MQNPLQPVEVLGRHGVFARTMEVPAPKSPGRKSRGNAVRYDRRRSGRRNRIEIMVSKSKDWRRIATRYDKCAKSCLSAIALA